MSTAAELVRQAQEARQRADELARAAAEAARLEREASRPKMPPVSAEATAPPVVRFSRYMAGRAYHYAAVGWRDGRHVRWVVTGSEARRFNWPGLLEFIGEANWPTMELAIDYASMMPEGGEPPAAEVMGRFGRVERTEDVVSPIVGYGQSRFARGGMVGPYEG